MKLKLTFVVVTTFLMCAVYSQKKGSLIGVHFNLSDFSSPASIEEPASTKGYTSVRNMNKGLSIAFWKGLTSKIDLSVKANAVFRDYSAISEGITTKTGIGGIELEPALNIRPFSDAAKLAPFITAGGGIGTYNGKLGGYIPAGGGIQVNFDNTAYLFVQAQYKFTLTPKVLGDNLFYSFGFAQKF